MNRIASILILIALAGCTHTPLQKVEDARAVYTTTLHEINVAHNAGFITVAQKKQMAPTTQAIATALDTAEFAAAANDTNGANAALATANAWLDKLLADAHIDPKTLKRAK